MKSERCFLRYWLILILSFSLIAGGCVRTYVPTPVKPAEIAFSGNNQNAGFIGFTKDGAGVIDSASREKYNILISIYFTNFIPPLRKDFGVTPYTNGTYLISAEGLNKFVTMNLWKKNGK